MPFLRCFRTQWYPEGITISAETVNCTLLVYYTVSSGNFLSTLRDNLSVPSSGFKNFLRCSQLLYGGSLQSRVVQTLSWEEVILQAAGYDQSIMHLWDNIKKAWELALSNSYILQHCGELYNVDLFIYRAVSGWTVLWYVTPYSLIDMYRHLSSEYGGSRLSDTSIAVYWTTRCHMQEDGGFRINLCEVLTQNFYNYIFFLSNFVKWNCKGKGGKNTYKVGI
jgi:hypothetical protein